MAALARLVSVALCFFLSWPASAQTDLQKRWFATIDSGNITAIAGMLNRHEVTTGTLTDIESNTALHLASERCNESVVKFLLSRGARTDLANKWRDTPLRIAAVRCGPNSPVTLAIQNGPGQSAGTQSGSDLNGVWVGQQSGNRVRQELRPDALYVFMVTQNAGQGNDGMPFRPSGRGIYKFRFPDGHDAVIQILAPGRLRVTNPDGWTDVFDRVGS